MKRYERHFHKNIVPIVSFSVTVVYAAFVFTLGYFISMQACLLFLFTPFIWMLAELNLADYIEETNWHKKKMLMVDHYDKIDEIEREAIEEKLNEEIMELKKLYK